MKHAKKFLVLLLLTALCAAWTPPFAALGAEETAFAFSESFNGTPTNGTPETLQVKGAKTRVIELSESNKAFQLLPGENQSTIEGGFSTAEKKFVFSLDLSGDSRISLDLAMTAGTANTVVLTIRGNRILTREGKEIGSVNSNTFSRLALAINQKTGKFSVYLNGRQILDRWKLAANNKFNGFSVTRTMDMTESLYLDNLAVYGGEEPLKSLPQGAFNTDGQEFLDITDDLGDFSFFKSNYITHRYVAYPNTTLTPKSNEIICEKFDYKNPEKGDRIIFKKQTDEDCYIDITGKIFTTYRSEKVYQNFKLSGDFMCDFDGDSSVYLYQLRDAQSGSSQVNTYPVTINADGSIKFLDGTVVSGAAQKGKWFNLTMYLNLKEHTMTAFLDGKKVVDNGKLPAELKQLSMTRVQCRSGGYTGEMQCRNMEFTGLEQPYEGEEVWTSMFRDDSVIEEYLADKTCFHYYGKNMYANGSKSELTAEPVYEGGELYVALSDFNRAYGVAAVLEGGKLRLGEKSIELTQKPAGQGLIPVMESAEGLLGWYAFDDTNGMIITSPKKIYFKAEEEIPYHKRKIDTGYIDRFSALQYIYDYLLFDRPDKEKLLSEFNAVTENGMAHPRVMATAKDFERIKEQSKTDEYMKSMVESLIGQADSLIKAEPIRFEYQDALRTTTIGDRLKERAMVCGFAYQMTGDKKYADGVWKNLSALDRFPDINPGHPIDTGSYGAGIAIGYDWCYDAYTEEQRENIRENAKRLHLTVIGEGFYGRSPVRGGPDGNINVIGYYNKWISNYNLWVNSGSVMMSLAFMDTYPEQCSDLLRHSIRSLEYGIKNLYPEGAWVESTNYWSIVARCMAYTYSSLQAIYGTDFKLSSFPGTSETGITNMALRSQLGSYNYHDAGTEGTLTNNGMAFMGYYFKQPEVLAARRATLTQAFDKRMPKVRADLFDVLYYDPAVKVEDISKLPRVKTAAGLELFAVHEDYTKYGGLYLAAHGGPVSFYHSHNDGGDFIFELNGVRWACALAAEDYNSTLSGSERYRMRTEGHNTVSINNDAKFNQLSNTYAPIIAKGESDGGAYAVYDMSESYADADKYLRGFYVGENYRSVTIRDEIELNKPNSEIYWFMHTEKAAEVLDDHTVILSADGESVTLNFEAESDTASVKVMDAVPLDSSPKGEGQNPNIGVQKVAIRLTGSGKVTLTVRIGEFAGTVDQTPISEWIAPERTAPTRVKSALQSVQPADAPATDRVLRYGKTSTGTGSAVTMELNLSRFISNLDSYEFTFDLLPVLTEGSFNFYLGGYFQLMRQEDGYLMRYREKDDPDFTELEFCRIEDWIPVRLVVQNRERMSLYMGERCVKEDVLPRQGFAFDRFGVSLNNGLRGYTYFDNLILKELTGADDRLSWEKEGDVITVTAQIFEAYENPRVLAAFYDEHNLLCGIREMNRFSAGILKESVPVPEDTSSVKLMLWDDMTPLCLPEEISRR